MNRPPKRAADQAEETMGDHRRPTRRAVLRRAGALALGAAGFGRPATAADLLPLLQSLTQPELGPPSPLSHVSGRGDSASLLRALPAFVFQGYGFNGYCIAAGIQVW